MLNNVRLRPTAMHLAATTWLALGLSWTGGMALADDRPWLDRSRTASDRAQLLVRQMTLEEKSALLYGYGTRDIDGQKWQVYVKGNPRLGIPDMVQGDSPAGIWQGSSDVTQLPASIALAATFSRDAARSYGRILGRETRALGYGVIHGPNIDVQRDPRHGRAHETFGEDPWLTSAIGTQYVLGVQENAVMADAKHFAVNTVEQDRRTTDARLSRKVLEELHLFPFQDAIEDASVAMVMCAYTRINGVHACNDADLLQGVLRKRLGFDGIVRTDAGAEHSLRSLSLGVDQEFRSEKYYGKDLIAAVTKGDFPEGDVDAAVVRIITSMIRYGIFDDPPQRVGADLAESRRQAQDIAAQSIVLLKNDNGILPLDPSARSIAVIGAAAADLRIHGGPTNPSPAGKTNFLDAIKTRMPEAKIVFKAGVDPIYGIAAAKGFPQLPSGALRALDDTTKGAQATYYDRDGKTIESRIDSCLCVSQGSQFSSTVTTSQAAPKGTGSVVWRAKLLADVAGRYQFDTVADATVTISIDGVRVMSKDKGEAAAEGGLDLAAGPHDIEVRFAGDGSLKVGWRPPAQSIDADIADAARAASVADVAIVFARDLESEELDRPTLSLPNDQDRLIDAVLRANPRTIVVLATGSAVTMPWLGRASAVVEAWYGGTMGAAALAAVLFGDINPSGRLPVTFPLRDDNLPTADKTQFPGVDRVTLYREGLESGYRYFNGANAPRPLFAFGHGLSYSTFAFSDIVVDRADFRIGVPGKDATFKGCPGVSVSVKVTNTSRVKGAAVPQLYMTYPEASGEPTALLRAFDKVDLLPGESKIVTFVLDQRAFSNFSERSNGWVVDAGLYKISVGASSVDRPLSLDVEAKSGP
ncbi:glycoside hydrolase family 3 C-terminal domain-containing protein [Bradyrhizobium manausense]|uniref:beta-glucosidase n=1 Tax=Bradyrhizobium manausense TaxID=989370 RepID=UPI001BABAC74|nr:glycoside hydrolase family 3 C-terminal domain-containing protein [Bradyrhizobium manausense]MBR1087238.1 glycoside hydrolase family 3 C-terminal domain-containing protein [Bradyrhizobium manausense]